MEHSYLRYECADWFGLTVASASRRAPAANRIVAALVGTGPPQSHPPYVVSLAGSGCTVTSLKSGQVVAKLAHYVANSGSSSSVLGTGRALNSDEMVCLDVQPSQQQPQLYKIATGWIDGAVRLWEVSLPEILQKGGAVAHSLLLDDEDDRSGTNLHKHGIFLPREPLLLQGHANPVRTVQWDDGAGHRLASGGSDGAVVVWDVVAETGLFRLLGHRGAITDLSFVTGGTTTATTRPPAAANPLDLLVSSSLDGLVKIWDLTAQCCTQTIASHHPLASVCRKSPVVATTVGRNATTGEEEEAGNVDPRWRLLTGGIDGRVRVWTVESSLRSISSTEDTTHNRPVNTDAAAAVPINNNSSSNNNTANVIVSPDDVCHYRGSLVPPPNVATSHEKIASLQYDGRFVGVLHANSKNVDVYRLRTPADSLKKRNRRLRRRQEKQNKKQSDRTTAAAGTKRGILDDPESSDDDDEDINNKASMDDKVDPELVQASDEFEYLATVRASHKVRGFSFVYSDTSNNNKEVVVRVVCALATNALETHALVRQKGDGKTSIVTSNQLATMDFYGHPTGIRSVALSSDDRLACTVSKNVTKVWNVATRSCIQSLSPAIGTKKSKTNQCYGLCAAFLPGNRHIVVGTREGHLMLLDIAAGDVVYTELEAHQGAIWSLDLRRPTADDSTVVIMTGSADKCVKFWNVEAQEDDDGNAGDEGQPMLVHTRTLQMADDVIAVGYSKTVDPTKRLVYVSTLDSTIKVFFDDSLKLYLSLYGHKLPALAVDASDDDVLLASAGADKTIKIWGLDFGDTHRTLHGHDDSITDLKFVRRSHNFFTASKDGSVRYWDGDRFEQILLLNGHCAEVNCLAISRTGAFVLSGSMDRQVRVWERTKDIVFLEEERERELEQIFDRVNQRDEGRTAQILDRKRGKGNSDDEYSDEEVVKNEDPQSEAAVRKSLLSVAAGDRIMEALERADQELKETALFRRTHGSDKKRSPNPLMFGLDPAPYVFWVLRTIKSAELEQSLIVLSMRHIERLMYYLILLLKKGSGVELCSRVAIFLVKAHQNQIIAASSMVPLVRELRRLIRMRLAETRDVVGFDLAAMKLISKAANERKQSFIGAQSSTKDIWADLGLGSDVAAALEGRSTKKRK